MMEIFISQKSTVQPLLISDYKLIFDEDTSLETPYGFVKHSIEDLSQIKQVHVNQVPCAMSGLKFKNLNEASFVSLIGNVSDKSMLDQIINKFSISYFNLKRKKKIIIYIKS